MKSHAIPLKKIFDHNHPCAFVETFQEAISAAERLPEGCQIVWLWIGERLRANENYRVCRDADTCSRQRENQPNTFIVRVWENGITEIPESKHMQMLGPVVGRTEIPPEPAEEDTVPSSPQSPPATLQPAQKQQRTAVQIAEQCDQALAKIIVSFIDSLRGAGLTAEKIIEVIRDTCLDYGKRKVTHK